MDPSRSLLDWILSRVARERLAGVTGSAECLMLPCSSAKSRGRQASAMCHYYKWGVDHHEYQPDFVAETANCIDMLEPKAANQMEDGEVREKAYVAVTWCQRATEHATRIGGKPWQYLLIPHDAIIESMTLEGLSRLYMRSFQIKNA
ncbi:MAG: hypothetical protein H7829_00970 [Magnetococcus sp. THC-1_WYH]